MPCYIPDHEHVWPEEGVLVIQKCEHCCGYCDDGKDHPFKYPWFLRRHVASVHRLDHPDVQVSRRWDVTQENAHEKLNQLPVKNIKKDKPNARPQTKPKRHSKRLSNPDDTDSSDFEYMELPTRAPATRAPSRKRQATLKKASSPKRTKAFPASRRLRADTSSSSCFRGHESTDAEASDVCEDFAAADAAVTSAATAAAFEGHGASDTDATELDDTFPTAKMQGSDTASRSALDEMSFGQNGHDILSELSRQLSTWDVASPLSTADGDLRRVASSPACLESSYASQSRSTTSSLPSLPTGLDIDTLADLVAAEPLNARAQLEDTDDSPDGTCALTEIERPAPTLVFFNKPVFVDRHIHHHHVHIHNHYITVNPLDGMFQPLAFPSGSYGSSTTSQTPVFDNNDSFGLAPLMAQPFPRGFVMAQEQLQTSAMDSDLDPDYMGVGAIPDIAVDAVSDITSDPAVGAELNNEHPDILEPAVLVQPNDVSFPFGSFADEGYMTHDIPFAASSFMLASGSNMGFD